MGVQGLWKLLSPAARTVSIETLRNKTLAIDISIWMVQFIKAMKNDQGEVLPNAHLLGTFRRLCRLLFHRIRPVMVFDGGVPEIKRQTVLARVRRRVDDEEQRRRRSQTTTTTRMTMTTTLRLASTDGSNLPQSPGSGSLLQLVTVLRCRHKPHRGAQPPQAPVQLKFRSASEWLH